MKNNIIAIFISFLSVLAFVSFYSLSDLYENSQSVKNLRDDRFLMMLKADELRQSSDDLTRVARTYTITADEQYKNNYYDILDIRDGIIERPYYYEGIYWDLLEPIRSQRHRANAKESLEEVMNELPFMPNELKLLEKAKELSDKLVSLEDEAFNAMEGRFKDTEGEYSIEGEVNQELAINLLHSHEYHIEKGRIMLPIDDFLFLFTKRTSLEIRSLEKDFKSSFYILVFTLLIFILSIFGFVFIEQKHIKEAILQNFKN